MKHTVFLFLPFAVFACARAGADDPAFLGVKLAPIPEALAAHLKDAQGAIVEEVVPGGPAEKAGLKRFDMIISLNGKAFQAPDEVRARIQESKPGETVKLGIIRGSTSMTLEATLAAAPAPILELAPPAKEKAPARGFLGIAAIDIPPVLAYHLGLEDGHGVLAGDVVKGSPAEEAGIAENDVVVALDGKGVQGPEDFVDELSGKKAGDTVKVEFVHKGEKRSIEVKLAERPKDLPEAAAPKMLFGPGQRNYMGPPRTLHRGKITLIDPDGSEHSMELPETLWKADEVFKDLERRFGDMRGKFPELKYNIEETLKDLQKRFGDKGRSRWSTENRVSVITSVEGPLSITIKDQNGVRTVTVLKDGKSIAQDLPWDKLDTLPGDVRGLVEKVAESHKDTLKVVPGEKNPIIPPLEKEEGKIRA